MEVAKFHVVCEGLRIANWKLKFGQSYYVNSHSLRSEWSNSNLQFTILNLQCVVWHELHVPSRDRIVYAIQTTATAPDYPSGIIVWLLGNLCAPSARCKNPQITRLFLFPKYTTRRARVAAAAALRKLTAGTLARIKVTTDEGGIPRSVISSNSSRCEQQSSLYISRYSVQNKM